MNGFPSASLPPVRNPLRENDNDKTRITRRTLRVRYTFAQESPLKFLPVLKKHWLSPACWSREKDRESPPRNPRVPTRTTFSRQNCKMQHTHYIKWPNFDVPAEFKTRPSSKWSRKADRISTLEMLALSEPPARRWHCDRVRAWFNTVFVHLKSIGLTTTESLWRLPHHVTGSLKLLQFSGKWSW